MSEPEANEKQYVGKNVVIVLATISIVLIAWLGGTLVLMYIQNINLQNRVNDLNDIVNHGKSEVWLSNKTFSISPNDNVSELFYTPYSGDVEVVGHINPANLNIWVNLTWSVYYGGPPGNVYLYTVSPTPFIHNGYHYYFDEEFPVVSFGQTNKYTPNVLITIGNNSTDTVTTVNVTITFYY
jgi:hypothetical protein